MTYKEAIDKIKEDITIKKEIEAIEKEHKKLNKALERACSLYQLSLFDDPTDNEEEHDAWYLLQKSKAKKLKEKLLEEAG